MGEGKLPVNDVLIVGGGLAGLGAAIALGRHGVRTTLLEREEDAEGAAIGLGERAVYALDELGILEAVMERGYSWWKDNPLNYGVYDARGRQLPTAIPEHGDDWTLPIDIRIYRPLLTEVMQNAARGHGVELLLGCSYRSVEPSDDRVVVELTTGERREFDLVVGADGIHSELRMRFFPDAAEPVYTGSVAFRLMFPDAPEDWLTGRHVVNGNGVQTAMARDQLFYIAVPQHMDHRYVEQSEAREIVRTALEEYRPSKMFEQIRERLTDDVSVIVSPFEWIFVEPPWHHGRVVLVGDAVHATAPTIGMAGGMALEDAVVLAQELGKTDDLNQALRAYAGRRRDRTKLVVEASANLVRTHQEHRSPVEEAAMRSAAREQLIAPY